jgi:hypothetical protein
MAKGGKYRAMVEQQIHITLGAVATAQGPMETAAS